MFEDLFDDALILDHADKEILGAMAGYLGSPSAFDYNYDCSAKKPSGRFQYPYGWVNGPSSAPGPLNGLSLRTKSLMITIGKVHLNGGNQTHWFRFPPIAHPPCLENAPGIQPQIEPMRIERLNGKRVLSVSVYCH